MRHKKHYLLLPYALREALGERGGWAGLLRVVKRHTKAPIRQKGDRGLYGVGLSMGESRP